MLIQDTLLASLRERVPDGVSVAVELIAGADGLTRDEIASQSHKTAPKRWVEFAAGRRAARRASGLQCSILPRPDGAPDWPKEHDGSISHDGRFAVALSAPYPCPVMIDVIDFQAQPPQSYLEVTSGFLHAHDPACPDALSAARAFSMKEVAIKCGLSQSGDTGFLALLIDGSHVRHVSGGSRVKTETWSVEDVLITLGWRPALLSQAFAQAP